MHRWIAMTLVPCQDIRCVHNNELKMLYATIKKIKIAPVMAMVKHWLQTFKASTYVSSTSLVTCIASSIGALDGQNVVYISIPRIIIDEHYLVQEHHLKYDDTRNLVFFFPGHTNEFPLPNRNFICISAGSQPSLLFHKRGLQE
jgi:hypothetical protein